MPKKVKADHSMMVVSPMPGTVVSINVAVGDSVSAQSNWLGGGACDEHDLEICLK